jgi:S-adenosylmethionine:tRNA-ribosyltransferase-isomerase (queuine synthetase)
MAIKHIIVNKQQYRGMQNAIKNVVPILNISDMMILNDENVILHTQLKKDKQKIKTKVNIRNAIKHSNMIYAMHAILQHNEQQIKTKKGRYNRLQHMSCQAFYQGSNTLAGRIILKTYLFNIDFKLRSSHCAVGTGCFWRKDFKWRHSIMMYMVHPPPK